MPTPVIEEAPAQHVAGGPKDKGRDQELHRQAVEVAVRLEIVLGMYRRLLKLQVGTGMIESEAMSMVWERTIGLTGHGSLMVLDVKEKEEMQCLNESELSELKNGMNLSGGKICWRDRLLIAKLIQLRIDAIGPRWKKSKEALSQELRRMSAGRTKEEMKRVWQEVQETRREVWSREHPLHQRKIHFLQSKARDCDRHPKCKDLNKLAEDRISSWVRRQTTTDDDDHELGETVSSPPAPNNPNPPSLHKDHITDNKDLANLDNEEEILLQKVKTFSDSLRPENIESVDEVETFGNVVLNKDERSLLNLGPGFMVYSDLDIEEMQVEATVTLTKIRWGRRSRGVENMTNEDIAKEEAELGLEEMLESERLNDVLNEEARDVIDTDSKGFCMGKQRATDQKNNREVIMPGPAPPNVEAAHNTRVGLWQEAFAKVRKKLCDKAGRQRRRNLTSDQEVALKSLSKKVAKNEIFILEADKGKEICCG